MLGVLAAGAGAGFGFAQAPGSGGPVIRTVLKDVARHARNGGDAVPRAPVVRVGAGAGPNGRGTLTGPAKDVALVAEQIDAPPPKASAASSMPGPTDVGRDVGFLKQIARRRAFTSWRAAASTCSGPIPPMSRRSPRSRLPTIWCASARANGYGAFGEIGETPDAAMSADERKVFRAVGKAHLRTNLPIFTHNAYGTGPNVPKDAGLRQLDAFESVGVKPERVAIGHTLLPRRSGGRRHQGSSPSAGAFVGFDRVTGGAGAGRQEGAG